MNRIHTDNNEIDFESVFNTLNEELSKANISLELICAGGYVMQRHGYRATNDIDAFFIADKKINGIIEKVGEIFNINKNDELWLNNSIANMNPQPPDKYCEIIYSFSHLTVKTVGIMYLLGMKFTSGREQDLLDAADIIRHDKKDNPFELQSILKDMDFVIDISMLLDVFGEAYGIDWLDEFYRQNEKELQNYF